MVLRKSCCLLFIPVPKTPKILGFLKMGDPQVTLDILMKILDDLGYPMTLETSRGIHGHVVMGLDPSALVQQHPWDV